MRQSGEPSVEEILESIKKVIARDNRVGAAETRRRRESHGVIEAEPPAPQDEGEDDVFDLQEAAELYDDHRNTGGADDGAITENRADEAPLLDDETRASMRETLTALAMLAEPGMPPRIVRSGETSLEGLTRELLRPALAEWLDKHLPPMVERLVAAEIARIVGKKG